MLDYPIKLLKNKITEIDFTVHSLPGKLPLQDRLNIDEKKEELNRAIEILTNYKASLQISNKVKTKQFYDHR